MRALTTALCAGLVACCTSSPRLDSPPPQTQSPTATAPAIDAKEPTVPSAQFTFVSRRREHPPLSTLKVDVALTNPGAQARWFLLQAGAGKGQGPIATSAFAVTTWSFVGAGNVVVAELAAKDSFYAIQLPPDAVVTLRSLKILLAGEPPANPMPLQVIVADTFTIGGEVPSAWTKLPATCEPRADATQDGAERLLEKTAPDLGTIPIEVQGATRLDASVAISDAPS